MTDILFRPTADDNDDLTNAIAITGATLPISSEDLFTAGASMGTQYDVCEIVIQATVTPTRVVPTLVSTAPADNATDVAVDAVIDLVFSEAVSLGTGDIVLRDNDGGWAALETFNAATGTGDGGGTLTIVTTTVTNDTVRITPGSDLVNSIEHAIRVAATAVEDADSLPFAGITDDTTVSFTTVAASSAVYSDDFTTDTSGDWAAEAGGSATIGYDGIADALLINQDSAWSGAVSPAITITPGNDYRITVGVDASNGPVTSSACDFTVGSILTLGTDDVALVGGATGNSSTRVTQIEGPGTITADIINAVPSTIYVHVRWRAVLGEDLIVNSIEVIDIT